MTGLNRDTSHRQTIPDTINNTQFRLQIGAQHKGPLRGSIQQPMVTEAETHSQTVDGAQGILWKSWRKD